MGTHLAGPGAQMHAAALAHHLPQCDEAHDCSCAEEHGGVQDPPDAAQQQTPPEHSRLHLYQSADGRISPGPVQQRSDGGAEEALPAEAVQAGAGAVQAVADALQAGAVPCSAVHLDRRAAVGACSAHQHSSQAGHHHALPVHWECADAVESWYAQQ